MKELHRRAYVEKVLELYRATPNTPGLVRAADRRFAQNLFDLDIPLMTVYAALVLAWVRRLSRPPDQPPLRPISTLHYFKPIIDELVAQPIDPGYLDYLRTYKTESAPRLLTAKIDHQIA